MVNSIKWMMVKNDPEKLITLYEKDTQSRAQIIDRLLELNEKEKLIHLASTDSRYRGKILDMLEENKMLTIEDTMFILTWLNPSQTQNEFLKMVTSKYQNQDLRKIVSNTNINSIARTTIKKFLEKNDKLFNNKISKNYLKLQMILDESKDNFEVQEVSNDFNSSKSIKENITDYMLKRNDLDFKTEYLLIKNILIEGLKNSREDFNSALSILSISKLDNNYKTQILKEIDSPELYFFDNFQIITQNTGIPFDSYKKFLSENNISFWIKKLFAVHYISEFVFLYTNYNQFKWLENYVRYYPIKNIGMMKEYVGTYYMTNNFGFKLLDIIIDPVLTKNLIKSSEEIQSYLLANIDSDILPIENYLKALLLIGGESNYKFFAKILNMQVVKNIEQTKKDIENNYLELKKKIDDISELKELIKNEIEEKSNLISEKNYNKVARLYFGTITNTEIILPQIKSNLRAHIPNLERFRFQTDENGKILLCRYIGDLDLYDYQYILTNFIEEKSSPKLEVSAVLALIKLGKSEGWDKINSMSKSTNIKIKELVADSMKILHQQIDQEAITKLALDKNYSVVKNALETIITLPNKLAISIFKVLVEKSTYIFRPLIAEYLGKLGIKPCLPLLVELIQEDNFNVILAVLKALREIKHPLSYQIAKNINTKKRYILDIEKMVTLITLGHTEYWDRLEKLSNLNDNSVKLLAKLKMIKLATVSKIDILQNLVNDSNPLITTLASSKIYNYFPEEGKNLLDKFLVHGNNLHHYYITFWMKNLDFAKVKNKLAKLFGEQSYKVKTIVAIVLAEKGIQNYLNTVEKNIINLDDIEHLQILETINDYPSKKAIPLLEKIALFQNHKSLKFIVEICKKLNWEDIKEMYMRLWEKSEPLSRMILARLFSYLDDENIVSFIKKEIKIQPETVTSELAFALIVNGDESGWDYFNEIINNKKLVFKIQAIENIAKFKTVDALNKLKKYILTPNLDIQIAVIKAVGEMHLKEGVKFLKKYIDHDSPKIRISVANALGEIPYQESLDLLKYISNDKDEYVKMSIEMAMEKILNPRQKIDTDIKDLFDSVMYETEWKIDKNLFEQYFNLFSRDYKNCKIYDLDYFADKIILTESEINERKEEINKKLTGILTGSTDIDEIVKAKEKANSDISKLASIKELINSILNIKDKDLNPQTLKLIDELMDTGNKNILQAIILVATKSSNKKWLSVIEKYVDEYYLEKDADLIISSLINKISSRILNILIKIGDNERARFYILYTYNYLIIHNDLISFSDLRNLKKMIKTSEYSTNYKNMISYIIRNLMENLL